MAIVTDEAVEIVETLSKCFGSRVYWGPLECGRSVYGRVENGMEDPMEVLEEVAAIEREYWCWPETEEKEFLRLATIAYKGRPNCVYD